MESRPKRATSLRDHQTGVPNFGWDAQQKSARGMWIFWGSMPDVWGGLGPKPFRASPSRYGYKQGR